MATIMDFKDAANIPGSRITTKNTRERDMLVTLRNTILKKFKECTSGLYYYNITKHDDYESINDTHKAKLNFNTYYMLKNVNINKEYLT